ncbi:MAG: [protein-PII] uridylyltransferase [Pseudomonadota bacterium]|nr:[protein-PII] uridylyltransferase [Pseudomonadota bacterium]
MNHLDKHAFDIITKYKAEIETLDAGFVASRHLVATKGKTSHQLRQKLLARSKIIDRCLISLWRLCKLDRENEIVLFATGGYGRREVFPSSDIDILILHQNDLTEAQQEKVEQFVQHLWDVGPSIGQSVRSLANCLQLAKEDHTVLTNLLNLRKVIGQATSFFIALRSNLQTNSVTSSEHFFHLKQKEYLERHRKHADTEYNLEPNIKEAPGGLRDIHTLLWISKYTLGLGSLTDLVRKRILGREELEQLQRAYDFIANIRYCLHLIVKRDENRLLFNYQKSVADMLGFKDSEGNRAVEHFMKTYYRHASTVAALVDLLLENVEEEISSSNEVHEVSINGRFKQIGHKIAVTHPEVFKETPSAVLELFYLLGQSPSLLGVRANTIRLLRDARYNIDDEFRQAPENTDLFLKILGSPYRLFTQLKRMKRYGILGRYLPEFGFIIGQMQFDLFHIYTVDAHALLVVQNMRLLRHNEAREKFPLASKIIHNIPSRTLLYIAGLYHDIAKGRGGDHSVLGAVDAAAFCRRHNLSEADTQLISWLVLHHLVMSVTAQKMDISDYRVIEDFANKVGDKERLDYLYLLTICDIAATSPKLLNPWRLSLMNQLYMETSQFFKRQLDKSEHWAGRASRTRTKAIQVLREKGILEQAFEHLWSGFGDEYFTKYSAEDIAWHTQAILQHDNPDEPLVIAGLTQESGTQVYTQIFIYTKDCAFLFVNSVAVLSELGLNILDARVLTSNNGYTLNTYIVDDDQTGVIASTPQIYRKICHAMVEQLKQGAVIPILAPVLTPRTHKHFDIKTRVRIHNQLDEPYAIISIITLDRSGLLALIGKVFAKFSLSVHSAKILTFGEKAEDFFYVSYQGGHLKDQDMCEQLYQQLHDVLKN